MSMLSDSTRKSLRLSGFAARVITALGMIAALIALTAYAARPVEPGPLVQDDHSFWRRVITQVGPDEARNRYLEATARQSAGRQHVAAHAFSRALYDVYGFDALDYCGTEYIAGCIHEVTAQIFFDSPDPKEFVAACEAKHTGETFIDRACAHGIGHGLLAQAGYTREGMHRAMGRCEELGLTTGSGACTYGVIMEWYFRYMSDAPDIYPEDDNPIALCYEFSGRARESCFFNISAVWMSAFDPDGTTSRASILKLGDACSSLPDLEHDRRYCILGAGRLIGLRGTFSAEERLASCDAAFPDPADAELCRSNVLFVMSL